VPQPKTTSRMEEVAARILGPRQGISDLLQEPPGTHHFLHGEHWQKICERIMTDRWDHLLAALNSKDFAEKEYQRGFCEALQYILELPQELFREDK